MKDSMSVAIVKPVDARCNLACSYCYMQNVIGVSSSAKVMSDETLRKLVDFFCVDLEEVEFIWHGGEPLLAGLDFYKRVVKYQKRWVAVGKRIANFLQTNGTLVNDEWVKFCKESGFLVGVSIDAPSKIHGLTRPFKNGKDSLRATLRGVKILKKAGVFNGAICCVSHRNWRLAQAVFDFFVSQGIIGLKFLRVRGPFEDAITQKQYVSFLVAIFKKWLEFDDPEIEIRDINSLIDSALGGNFRECLYMGRCDKFVTVYSDGSIYACDNLPQSPEFRFGNVRDKRTIVLRSENFARLARLVKKQKDECRSRCEWFSNCKGGCLARHFQTRKEEEWCDNLKTLFAEVRNVLKKYRMI